MSTFLLLPPSDFPRPLDFPPPPSARRPGRSPTPPSPAMLPPKSRAAALALLLLSHLYVTLASDDEEPVEIVTYGSTIKLEHVPTGVRLHSHDVSYGSGSGQQSVTGFHDAGDSNSYWIVKAAHGAARRLAGEPVKCGDWVRLQHLNTGKNLHSHDHRAPMNADAEVSAYALQKDGRWFNGDTADNWVLECVARGAAQWKRFEHVRFKHQEGGKWLAADARLKFREPIPGQLQVSGSSRQNANTVWKTNEGFYFAPPKPKSV
ncbi:unnamed protein product [Chondrus crispus]|uniref:MIR domain-containing protein n=1 Tax=Chondrus crispus TaxID=2769 RepID=R7QRP9_CHOCR|nr:unnamed protein product [Chondrus crispus]CDF41172.1 unnamed protein product [Chondrus crispus]|eukprot:XP_005711466.1 unnamed protein product [Chondrus crispus]